jgi:hypothetical protein
VADERPALAFHALDGSGLRWLAIKRAAIPGGWLVVVEQVDGGGVTFVPDPEHRWDGGSVDVKRSGQ